jgi:integrase
MPTIPPSRYAAQAASAAGHDAPIATEPSATNPRLGRRALWKPATCTAEDERLAEEFLRAHAFDRNSATRERIRRQAQDFFRLNEGSTINNVYLLLVGQWRRCGLKFSTIDTYFGYLRPHLRAVATATDFSKFGTIAKAVALAHAGEETKTAPDSTSEELLRITARAQGDLQPLLYIMLTTGARVADLQRVKRRQIALTASHTTVIFGVTKNRRRRSLRKRLIIPHTWFGSPDASVRDFFAFGEKDQPVFGSWTANTVNERLRDLCALNNSARLTSYSFRRNYMRKVLEVYEGDAVKAQRHTLHLNPHIVEAHYAI